MWLATGADFELHEAIYMEEKNAGKLFDILVCLHNDIGSCNEAEDFVSRLICLSLGGLSLAVEGPSKAEITCTDNKDGTCSVQYLPTAPGEYSIIIKFADKHISGSPFTANVIGPGTWKLFSLMTYSFLLPSLGHYKRMMFVSETSAQLCDGYSNIESYP